MLFVPNNQDRLGRLIERIRDASTPDARLFCDVIANASERTLLLVEAGKAARLKRLIEASAWTEAALVLVELELPQWKLRRLIYEEGAWLCSLSNPSNLPVWLGDCVET